MWSNNYYKINECNHDHCLVYCKYDFVPHSKQYSFVARCPSILGRARGHLDKSCRVFEQWDISCVLEHRSDHSMSACICKETNCTSGCIHIVLHALSSKRSDDYILHNTVKTDRFT